LTKTSVRIVRFGSSWSTQFRLIQAIGKGLSELTPISATVVVGERSDGALQSGEIDVAFAKSVNMEHLFTGKGVYARKEPLTWLRSIAWLPQEDRFFFAVAPWTGLTSFEDIAQQKPALKLAGRIPSPVVQAYGFSYDEIERWGGHLGSTEHTAAAARARYGRGELDAFAGDGSAFDGSCWPWLADHGYRFLDIRADVMEKLEKEHGLRRNVTPVGFFHGIDRNLLALDDSHIVLSCHERMDEELAYLLAKVIDERAREIECESIQVTYGESPSLPALTQPTMWSSLTSRIERQWDSRILGAPLHPGAERYYREQGVL
jgi:uncharacterized protein